MRLSILTIILFFLFSLGNASAQGVPDYKSWDRHPQHMPRITAEEVRQLMLSGENILFVYAGYEVEEVVCGSVFISYLWVPPSGDGSMVRPTFPKDWWVLAY